MNKIFNKPVLKCESCIFRSRYYNIFTKRRTIRCRLWNFGFNKIVLPDSCKYYVNEKYYDAIYNIYYFIKYAIIGAVQKIKDKIKG